MYERGRRDNVGRPGRFLRRQLVVAAAVVAAAGAAVTPGPGRAMAAAQSQSTFREFPIPSGAIAGTMTSGPDGNLWFTLPEVNKIARMSPGGAVTEFSLPVPDSYPCGIAAGPDGNLWFTELRRNAIGRITTGGVITEFVAQREGRPPLSWACDLVSGPDRHLWLTHTRDLTPGSVQRISLDGTGDSYRGTFSGLPIRIAAGADGALWVTQAYAARLGRVTTGGSISEVVVPDGNYNDVAAGPDGNLWVVGSGVLEIGGRILRVTPGGAVTDFVLDHRSCVACLPSLPVAITSGPQGKLWFLDETQGAVGSITPDGFITTFRLPSLPYDRRFTSIVAGQDGNLWFIQNGPRTIGRLSPAAVATPHPDPSATTTLPPGLSPPPVIKAPGPTPATAVPNSPSAPGAAQTAPSTAPGGGAGQAAASSAATTRGGGQPGAGLGRGAVAAAGAAKGVAADPSPGSSSAAPPGFVMAAAAAVVANAVALSLVRRRARAT